MNLGIYKQGQGHWVRVMTAVLAGLVIAALAIWVYGQMQVLADRLPKSGYRIGLATQDAGAFAPGDRVELATVPDSTGKTTPVGSATVNTIDPERRDLLSVKDFTPAASEKAAPPAVTASGTIRKAVADAKVFSISPRGGIAGIDPVHPDLLAGGVAGLVLLIGALTTYWFVAVRPRTVEFLIATDFEMKKVNWSTPREVIGHTWVVIGACVLLAGVLFVVDFGLKSTFALIGLLPN